MQINITCGIGSTGRIALMLYDECMRQGYDSCFAYSAYKPTLVNAFSIETKFQNYIRRTLNKFMGRKQVHSNLGTNRLIKFIENEKPDLIHLHNIQQNSLNYIHLFSYLKEKEIPIVFTLHDCWSFTGGCYHFTERKCFQYETGCKNCSIQYETDDIDLKMQKSYEAKKRLIGENKNIHIICVSNWLKNEALKSYMKLMTKVSTIYNGIDTDVFCPQVVTSIRKRLGIDENVFVILGVASVWDDRKGLNLFTEIIKKLNFMHKVILVGLNKEQLNNLDPQIIGLPRTDNLQQLVELYSCADVYINASKEETFGLTTAEAMACGTPVIVYNSTACSEIVNERTGCIIHGEGVGSVIKAINTIKTYGKLYYTANCTKQVKEKFSKEIMLKNYIHLYRSLL